ncbi:signal peptidase I [Halonatronum saccharophilum]|uniref:signal peptidase I n=1 Tax=Halonatronum saccharophilum TaxID=150060 RepID=UPI0004857AD8|nr:signal peptidase I [Halonatronum saccharophilum]
MIREYLESLIISIILAFLIITFVVQAFFIPSGSMRPLLEPGDRILVNKFIYRFTEPKRQEIIVFKYPVDPRRNFIKRLIGMPGDEVEIINGVVHINGEVLEEDYLLERNYADFPAKVVPEGHYFMLGDNRNNSEDSRYWGFVPEEKVVGRAFVIFWPLNRISLIN